MDKLRFQSFGSGSSGNCYYIGNSDYGFLIDAGIGIRTVKKYLKNIGLNFENILGVFITHDHLDHIRALGPLERKLNLPVFSTQKILRAIDENYYRENHANSPTRNIIEKNETICIRDFSFTAFHVSHDATDNVGYTVEYKKKKFTFATDLGCIGTEASSHLKEADYLVLEANYDEQMLKNGSYPEHLKRRISSSTGHLSNDQTGLFLSENFNNKIKNIFLCHLSKENNSRELALNTVCNYLENKNISVGVDVKLDALERLVPSNLYEF
ncbi:MAG: MBL fold metallo-hydrolase [Paludibacteraceae bacterium]|jgi:phosphoribosyl 1,2-cyclic phosphodiesterase|nr:MBL fold metallo-hydrolase [Paludibacteraceae bacterium]MBP9017298.1 MBL fold metallo-hydrolase [Paludibacteraceae bacterium]